MLLGDRRCSGWYVLKSQCMSERTIAMTSVAYVSDQVKRIMQERANELAKQTGCIQRVRKFSGASLLQTLIFGWQQHPHASLEMLASTAELGEVSVTDTAHVP